jgi:hypothetical protein
VPRRGEVGGRKRFTVEESFRDQKDLRFGMGLSETLIGSSIASSGRCSA